MLVEGFQNDNWNAVSPADIGELLEVKHMLSKGRLEMEAAKKQKKWGTTLSALLAQSTPGTELRRRKDIWKEGIMDPFQ